MSTQPFHTPSPGAVPRAMAVPAPDDGDLPATYGQRALWFLDRLAPGNPAYVIAGAVRVIGELDAAALHRAAGGLVARHPALRTTFEAGPGGPLQRTAPAGAVDFQEIPGAATLEEMPGRLAAAAFAPFDLAAGPLLRLAVLPLIGGGHALALAIHHIAADFWSLSILVRELGLLYARAVDAVGAEETEADAGLPPPPALSPGDLARREEELLAGCQGERLWQYWREALAGVPLTLDLPTDRPRPPVQGYRAGACTFELPAEVLSALRRATRRQGATLYMGLLAAFELLLARTAGQERLIVGCPTTGRVAPELAGVVGYLVNPVPIPGDLSGEPTLPELLARVREAARGAFEHQGYPFPLLAERLLPERDPSRSPVFQAALVLQKGRRSGEGEIASLAVGEAGVRIGFGGGGGGALALESIALPEPGVQFDLAGMLAESGSGGLRGRLQYDRDLFDATTAARMAERFARLAAGLAAGLGEPELRVSDLPWMSPAERQQVLAEWNDTAREPGPEGDLPAHEQVRAVARRAPDRTAIADSAGTLTYGELARRAERLARRLAVLGVGPEVPVAVCARRSTELVLAALAVLQAGGTYVPLDPSYPRERLGFVLEDLGRPLVLAHPEDRGRLPGWASPLLLPAAGAIPAIPAAALPGPDLGRRAYIIYTSGSTGRPKGVEVEHRSFANVLAWQRAAHPLSPGDRTTLVAGPSFDASIWETWTALASGASLHVPADEVRSAPPRLVAWLVREAITVSFLPTPLAEAVAAERWPERHALREVTTGGDRLHAPPGPELGLNFVNLYGPAECTLLSTAGRVRAESAGVPPIGRPLAATQVYLLDLWDRPAPLGVAGELGIGGAGVARGYWGRPELTAERFVPDPGSRLPGARLYRTGDLARFRADGELDYLGRLDTQVKVRGVRVELGEIEALLAAHPGVREAVVGALPGPSGVRLVAYVVPAGSGTGEELRRDLRAYLLGHLPEPVVPAAYVALPELPLTPNGKVDRQALARLAPEPGRAGAPGSPMPRGGTEERLAGIWSRVLGIPGITGTPGTPEIAADDDFFALGGHSLLATRVIEEVREAFGVELPVRRLFEVPRLADLAREIEAARAGGTPPAAPPLRRRPREGPLPLSFAQERLWFLDQLDPGSPAYNVPGALALRGRLSAAALHAALGAVVERHEALRTTFALPGGIGASPVQEVAPRLAPPFPELDLGNLPAEARVAEALRLAGEEGRRGFDLGRGPLLRATLLRVAPTEHWLLLTLHHIVADGWSMGVLARELGELYGAALQGRPAALPELPVQYGDYAVWQREWLTAEVLAGELAWWRERLAGAPTLLELPADRPRPAVQSFRGAHRPVALPPALSEGVRGRAQAAGATLYMTLVAAWGALLSRYTGEIDLLVGSPMAGRDRPEVSGLVGFFVNTLVLRLDLAGRPGLGTLVARAREATLAAYAHQEVPFERLVEELRPERHLGHAPLVQVLFALQNLPGADLALPGVDAEVLAVESGVAKFDLTLALREEGGTLRGVLEYAVDLFEGATAERLRGHFETLLAAAVAAPEQPILELPLLSAAERQAILIEWNAPGEDYPGEGLVHELVAERARRDPRPLALVLDGLGMTYGELEARAARIGRHLTAAGVGPERLVAIAVERSFDLVAALLGIWKAGGAYLPLDVSLPSERLAFMLADSGAAVLLTQRDRAAGLPAAGARTLAVEDLQAAEPAGPAAAAAPPEWGGTALLLDHPAYVIYTSGSTGHPKGVVVTHRALANRMGFVRGVDLAPGDSFVHKTTISFDASISEIFGPLLVGGTTYLARPGGERDPEYLVGLLREHAVPQATFTTAMLQALLDAHSLAECRSLRTVLVGGEATPADLPARFYAQCQADLHNRYGPTEATISVTSWHCGRETRGRVVPIGRPIARAGIHLLDRELQPVPIGVPGELCIAGVCLARGYLHRPERTAERFVPHPSPPEPGARLYRTGDLTRFRPDGAIEFVGRMDGQVKVRGFRVELGEVEAALAADPAVEQAAVVDREEPGTGSRRLLAYLVPRAGTAPTVQEIRGRLAERVPGYMVPALFVLLDRLPLSPTGKVDKKALPDPEPGRSGADDPPQGEIEELLAGLWADLLGTAGPIGRHESFFDLGGHSLLATRLASRVRQTYGVELPLKAVFERPSLAGVAAAVERALAHEAAEAPPILPAAGSGGELPLSFAQERLWFLDQLAPETSTYNLAGALRLAGRLDLPALARALAEIVRRHSALRTTFPRSGDRPVQVIAPHQPPELPVLDLAALPEAQGGPESRRLAREAALRPFDLVRGPLLRLALVRLDRGEEHLALVSMHHIVSDGWSIGVLVRELGALYGAFVAGRPSPLPELPVQYADFALWQREWLRGERLAAESAYWREALTGLDPLDLPADRPRPPVRSTKGALLTRGLSPDLAAALLRLARAEGETLFMVLSAGLAVLLSRYTSREDLAVGSAVANRTWAEVEGLIGFFVNAVVLRTDLAGDPPFRELLGRVRRASLAAFAHQDLPFEKVVEAAAPERDPSRTPLFQVLLTLQNAPMGDLELPGLTLSLLPIEGESARFDLSLSFAPGPEGWVGTWEYSRDLFDPPTIARMAGHLEILLSAATAGEEGPGRRLSELPLLSPPERAQLLVEWSGGEAAYPREASLYSLFAGQAALRPDAVALVAEGARLEYLSYGGLAARAEGLARRLLGLGVTPGTRVGLCLDRSAERVTATLAILVAGGAYVPLDPSYPRERLDFLVRDSAAPLLLTVGRLLPALPKAGAAVVCLDRPASPALAPAAGPRLPEVPAEALAYVMYTSGSTGVPKGVAVPQRGVVRLVRGTGYARFGPGESLLQLAPYAFDAATLELWAALLHGGRAVMPPPGALSLAELEALVLRHGVSTLHLTAGLFHQAVDAGLSGFAGLRQLLTGGDALSAPHVGRAAAELPGTRLLCCYGPTENTTFTAVHPVDGPLPGGTAPLGRPIANTQVYVLDRDLGPAPLGVPGELYAGGDGLAWGYLGRPDLTAERFLPNPCPRSPGERLYRTGDLARWRPGGWLEFLGRTDAQVKVRGFRVEPGEVEAALRNHPGVREAVVLVRGEAGEDRRLVAYVVAEERDQGERAADLSAYLRGRLPEHMVPAVFVLLPALPLTGHGKVDRRALARIAPAAGETRPPRAGGAPRTEVEALLAGIWAEVLGVGRVGIEDDFFALGGHSLLATQVVSRLRQALGVELPLRRFFAAPTVAGLAREVAALAAAAGRGGAVAGAGRRVPDPKEPLPLSFAQERLWFLDQLEPGSTAYNLPTALRLSGRLDPAVLAASLGRIVARHEALRTTFRANLEGPYQVIAPALPLDLPGVDLGGLPARTREAELARLAREESVRPFDLAAGPLVRAALLRLAAEAHVLFLTFHHIVADAWSMGVLVRELGELYPKLAAGRPPLLPELPIQYADHALWQRRWLAGEALEREIAHWRQALAGLEPLDLPLDRPRPARRRGRGGLHRFALGPRLATALGRLAREEGATLFMTLLAGLSALLARYAGQEDVAVGSAVANRTHRESEPLIGFFVNTLVFRADLAGDPGFRQALGRLRQTALAAYAHQDLPFEKLVLALSPERDTSRTPLFQVFFALQNTPMEPLDLPGLHLEPMEMPVEAAKFDLALTLGETAEGLSGAWSYDRDLFDATTVERLTAHFERLLAAAAAQPDLPFWDLPLSGEAEREQLREWNDVPGTPAPAGCLHERFWAQAGRTPDAVALVWGGERLSYGALHERAARAARRLRRLGVGPEVRVGVFARRGPDLVAALLGVLAAGGAYVPLDPEYPAERLGVMLADSGAPLVLAGPGLAERLPAGAAPRLLDLGELWAPEARDDPGPSRSGVSPANLAYLIYTSGSTGRPKGVAIAHRSAAARVGWAAGAFGAGEFDGVLAATSVCFDLSVFELFVPLSLGGRVILADNALALADLSGAWEVTLVNTVPSALAELVRAGRVPGSVATVNLAGEPLPRSLAEAVYGAGVGRVSNLYGPSEDTTYSTVERVERGGRGEPAIGRPLAGSQAWVVDLRGGLAPLGVPGELWLGGGGLARGYLDRPDLTAERFVPDPWGGEAPGARLYRTGDRVRHGMDGRLLFLGRLDRQVKVRGFRIELGELEAVLAAHPRVREAVVLARQDSPGDVRLVAYVVASSGPAGVGEPGLPELPERLRAHLAGLLPSHMIPAAFVLLEALPLSPTGKVDRRALPAPEWRPEPGGIPPRTPLEEVIAGLFAEVLGVERVGVRDSFFHLGGHSLKAVQLASRLRAIFNVDLPVRCLFETPTVEALAAAVAAGEPRPGQSEKLARVLLRVKQGSLPRR